MSLTITNISRTGQGRLTVYMKKGLKTTESVYCSRSEIQSNISSIVSLNGGECEKLKVYFNGILLN
jgi:hypothetical protein